MKIVFLTNYYNHHQKNLSAALNRLIMKYSFVTTSEMSNERLELGYGETIIPKYVISTLDSNSIGLVKNTIEDAEVIIIGSAPHNLIRNEIKKNKLVFRYSERTLKSGNSKVKYLFRWLKWNIRYPNNKQIFLLCASAFAAYDYSIFGLFKDKAYKFGYFTEVIEYDIEHLLTQKEKNRILWCGRLIQLKHPYDAICIAERLKNEGYCFTMELIGIGELQEKLMEKVESSGLSDTVVFKGAMRPDEVRKYMEGAGIFLFTSDKNEGWGAVLNESMNSGCAVVASHAIGSVPYLLEDGKNGIVYESGNVEDLYNKVKFLLDNPNEQQRYGRAAYHTITELWNAEVAAERLINLAKHILEGEKSPDIYESGPCSKAEIVCDNWYVERLKNESTT